MMNLKTIALILLVPFLALTAYAVVDVGYIGIFELLVNSSAGWQVFADLAISLLLVCCWIVVDAKKNGRNPWPYLVATLFVGSIAPLFYLALSKGD